MIAEAGTATLSIATAAAAVRDANNTGRRKFFVDECDTYSVVGIAPRRVEDWKTAPALSVHLFVAAAPD